MSGVSRLHISTSSHIGFHTKTSEKEQNIVIPLNSLLALVALFCEPMGKVIMRLSSIRSGEQPASIRSPRGHPNEEGKRPEHANMLRFFCPQIIKPRSVTR